MITGGPNKETGNLQEKAVPPYCEQDGCDAVAEARMFWPGSRPLSVCAPCAVKAQTIGRAMGCYVHVEVFPSIEVANG